MTRRQREEEDGRKRSAEEQTDRNGLREGVEREQRREARVERREEREERSFLRRRPWRCSWRGPRKEQGGAGLARGAERQHCRGWQRCSEFE